MSGPRTVVSQLMFALPHFLVSRRKVLQQHLRGWRKKSNRV